MSNNSMEPAGGSSFYNLIAPFQCSGSVIDELDTELFHVNLAYFVG